MLRTEISQHLQRAKMEHPFLIFKYPTKTFLWMAAIQPFYGYGGFEVFTVLL